MGAEILPFPSGSAAIGSPIANFIRIGEAHRKAADLHAAGGLPARRVVFDASRIRYQQELITAFRENGAEIVLDTEVAELAALSKLGSHIHKAPWARPNALLGPEDFVGPTMVGLMHQIARFAVTTNVHVVLAPTHYVSDPTCNDWMKRDLKACAALRNALDREGGSHIAIDFPFIVSHTTLNDSSIRAELLAGVVDLPVDHLWLRASGMKPTAGPQTVLRYLMSLAALHNIGKPIIADYLGGLAGLIAVAFGGVSGLCHGFGERERFDAASWHRARADRGDSAGFGRAVRVIVPDLHRSLTINELELLASARGGRRLVSCDRSCCVGGYADMISDPLRHAANQGFRSISSLEAVPDLKREEYFLNGPMKDAQQRARQIRALRPTKEEAEKRGVDLHEFINRQDDHARRIEKLRKTLEHLHESRSNDGARARAVERENRANFAAREKRR